MRRPVMRTFRAALLGAIGVVSAAVLVPGCAEPPGAPSLAGFQVTVYETKVPAERVGQIDAKALSAKAAGAADLQKALAELGPTRVLYHTSQPVSLDCDTRIIVGTRRPFVRNARLTEGGRTINSIQYESVGAIFKLSCQPLEASGGKHVDMRLNAEISAMDQGETEISPGVRTPVTHQVEMNYNAPAEIGRPFVMLSVGSPSDGKDARCAAYVCRVVLTRLP
ncbi:MAG: hypothetical protein WBF17_23100 [Phycisphaerae bacterium]